MYLETSQDLEIYKSLIALVKSFNDDDGVSEATFEATHDLIKAVLGIQAAVDFSGYVDATDSRFYFKTWDDCAHWLEKHAPGE